MQVSRLPSSSRSWSRPDTVGLVAIVAIVAAVYARTLAGEFLDWDDNRFITGNPLFREGGWSYVAAAWSRIQFDAFHPLHILSYLPDRYLWPDAPAGFHALSLAIFELDVVLAFLLLRRHVGPIAAALACLAVALHPLCVEPVAWISARKDVMSLAFFLGVLLVEDRRKESITRPSLLGLLLGVAAILTKTSTICLPLVCAAWLRWVRGATARTAVLRALPYALLAAVASVVVLLVWSDHRMIPDARPDAAPIDVAATLATYVWRVVCPIGLSPVYPAPAPHPILGAIGLVTGVIGLAVTWSRLSAAARYGAVAFVACLLPVVNIVPVIFRFADRYAFLAVFALLFPIAIVVERVRPRRAVVTAMVLVIGIEAAMTWSLAGSWHDSRALWDRAVDAQPSAQFAHFKRGEILRDQHDWEAAISEYQTAIRLDPDSSRGYAGLLYVYARRAESSGKIGIGAADRWLAALGPALESERAFAAFYTSIPHDACQACSNLVLGMGLMRWPQPDAALIEASRRASAANDVDVALVYLASVKDRTTPGFAEALKRASQSHSDDRQ